MFRFLIVNSNPRMNQVIIYYPFFFFFFLIIKEILVFIQNLYIHFPTPGYCLLLCGGPHNKEPGAGCWVLGFRLRS